MRGRRAPETGESGDAYLNDGRPLDPQVFGGKRYLSVAARFFFFWRF